MNLRPFFSSIGKSLGNAGKSVGNAFKTGWNNGNIQKGMAITGMTAFGVGLTGAIIHDMKRSNGSIFGGCGCNSFGFGGNMNMYGFSPYNMGIPTMGFNMFGMNSMPNMGMYSSMGMLNNMSSMGCNPYNTQMGNMMAYQWGQQLAMEMQLNTQPGTAFNGLYTTPQQAVELPELNYDDEAVTGADKTSGQKLNDSLDALTNDKGQAIAGKNLKIEGFDSRTDGRGTYKTAISELAKSYLANIDTDNDGLVSEEEFVQFELSKLEEDADDAVKQEAETRARTAFKKLDANNSDSISWHELGGAIATFDTNSGGQDGIIKSEEYSNWSTLIGNKNSNNFDTTYRKNLRSLFGFKKD